MKSMAIYRILLQVFCFFCLLFRLNAVTYFQAERLAIEFKMPTLVENDLRSLVLCEFPKGNEARKLMAQCCYLKKNFVQMRCQLDLTERDNSENYLEVLYDWYTKRQVRLSSLLLAQQSHCFGVFLSQYNEFIFEPIGSIRWACFWLNQKVKFGTKYYEDLYALGCEIKTSIDCFENKNNWQQMATHLYLKENFFDLKNFLQEELTELKDVKEKLNCLLWMLKVKSKLNENVNEDIINFLVNKDIEVEDLDVIFTEWMRQIPDVKKRLAGLKTFHKIYKKKKFYFHCQYLQLLQANCLLDLGEFDKAKKILDNNIKKFDDRLQSFGYELLARHALCQTSVNYRLVADYLMEAKKRTKDTSKVLFYSKLQAECYCLTEDYDRAFCIYQEVLPFAEGYDIGIKLTQEWILCGILCNETVEDLQAQFEFCRKLNFLSENLEQELYLKFVAYKCDQNNLELSYNLLKNYKFIEKRYQEQAKLLLAKCYYKSNAYQQAYTVLNEIISQVLDFENYAEFLLWQSLTLKALGKIDKACEFVQKIFDINKHLDIDLLARAKLLQAEILAEQRSWSLAKQCLLDFYPRLNVKWQPVFLFQSGLYSEQNGLMGQKEAIDLFQKLYDQFPTHMFALDGRLKQGTLFMNLNQMAIAQQIFENILPNLKQEQALWCKFLIQKCSLLSEKQTKTFVSKQLELLLQEKMPLSLRLEIVLQLALIYKDEGNINLLQKILWNECSVLLESEDTLTFSVNEAYWLSRCLLLLAQNTKDPNVVRQICTLMIEAQLPSASLVRQYIENE